MGLLNHSCYGFIWETLSQFVKKELKLLISFYLVVKTLRCRAKSHFREGIQLTFHCCEGNWDAFL